MRKRKEKVDEQEEARNEERRTEEAGEERRHREELQRAVTDGVNEPSTRRFKIKKEMFAGQIFPDFAGGEIFINNGVEIFVNLQDFLAGHALLDLEIIHDGHIVPGLPDDPVYRKLGGIMENG